MSIALGIDAQGDIVGNFQDSTGAVHGYVLSRGNFQIFDPPGSSSPSFTLVFGINPAGTIVGFYISADGGAHGYLYTRD